MDTSQLDVLFSSLTRGCNDEIYSQFTQLMFEFIDRLIIVFHKHEGVLRQTRNQLGLAIGNCNAKEIVHGFMDNVDPVKHKIAQRDATVFNELNRIDFFKTLSVHDEWARLSAKTQDAIWGYLGKLVVLGTKAIRAEAMFAPLQDKSFRKRIIDSTIAAEQEFTNSGREINSMDDVLAIAAKVNEKLH